MPSDVIVQVTETAPALSSAALAETIRATDFSACAATVIGYGHMGREYVKALRALGVPQIRVCSRSPAPLEELHTVPGVETVSGGCEQLRCRPGARELGIVATPVASLVAAAERLAVLGFRALLIEKPVSLWSHEIQHVSERLARASVEAVAAYNRVTYPSVHEVRARVALEGGATSCEYSFTELIKSDWCQRFGQVELARWGVTNSLHVIAMAHALVGWPARWSAYRTGDLPWHPTGRVFAGAGVSDRGVPFVCHADWGSTGRWSVEVHTAVSSYRLCPLERLFRRAASLAEWSEEPVIAFAPHVKAGFVEQVAAMLSPAVHRCVPLVTLTQAAMLTRFVEELFGYASKPGERASTSLSRVRERTYR